MNFFGGRAQVVVGVFASLLGFAFWILGTLKIESATTSPINWSEAAFIFHASMFFGLVACYSIVSNGLTFKATERVEEVVTSGDVEVQHADHVELDHDA